MPVANFGHPHVTKADSKNSSGWYHFRCGHCGSDVSGAVVAYAGNAGGGATQWLLCPVCHEGSVHIGGDRVYPGVAYGPDIEGLPADVKEAYGEARRCLSINADTASEVMCRKILMHVAVDKGAKEGKTFAHYIDYLKDKGYVTPPMLGWVDLIREHGNESNHRLSPPERRRAEGTLQFTAQLLRSVYEMEHLAKAFAPEASKPGGSAP
jgi:uncharacterized protein DUF4145